MALQIAKLKGARLVIGSSTNATRRARLKDFGADLAVDSSDPGWVDEVLKATGGEGVDLIVDQVSGKVAKQNLAVAESRAISRAAETPFPATSPTAQTMRPSGNGM